MLIQAYPMMAIIFPYQKSNPSEIQVQWYNTSKFEVQTQLYNDHAANTKYSLKYSEFHQLVTLFKML